MLQYCCSPIDLADVLPRLWPYLDHSTSSVRKATLQTLRTITRPLITSKPSNGQINGDKNQKENESSDKENADDEKNLKINENKSETDQCLNWTPELLQEAMRHIYQRVLFEHVHDIQEIAVQVSHVSLI